MVNDCCLETKTKVICNMNICFLNTLKKQDIQILLSQQMFYTSGQIKENTKFETHFKKRDYCYMGWSIMCTIPSTNTF